MDRQAQRDIRRKLNGLQFAPDCGSVIKNVARKSVAPDCGNGLQLLRE